MRIVVPSRLDVERQGQRIGRVPDRRGPHLVALAVGQPDRRDQVAAGRDSVVEHGRQPGRPTPVAVDVGERTGEGFRHHPAQLEPVRELVGRLAGADHAHGRDIALLLLPADPCGQPEARGERVARLGLGAAGPYRARLVLAVRGRGRRGPAEEDAHRGLVVAVFVAQVPPQGQLGHGARDDPRLDERRVDPAFEVVSGPRGLGRVDRGDEGVLLRRPGVGELEVAARALREVVAARQVELVGLVVRRQRDRREAREPGVPADDVQAVRLVVVVEGAVVSARELQRRSGVVELRLDQAGDRVDRLRGEFERRVGAAPGEHPRAVLLLVAEAQLHVPVAGEELLASDVQAVAPRAELGDACGAGGHGNGHVGRADPRDSRRDHEGLEARDPGVVDEVAPVPLARLLEAELRVVQRDVAAGELGPRSRLVVALDQVEVDQPVGAVAGDAVVLAEAAPVVRGEPDPEADRARLGVERRVRERLDLLGARAPERREHRRGDSGHPERSRRFHGPIA